MPTSAQRVNRSAAAKSAPVQLNLTAAGWTVLAMMVAAAFISGSSRIAVGFFIPLAAALIIDVYLSWHYVTRQTVSILPARNVVHHPDGIPLRVRADGPGRPMRVTVTFRGGGEQAVGVTDEPVTIEMRAGQTGVANYLRVNAACTVFGFGLAHRWQTHSLATLHWSPAPGTERVPTPDAVDEVARLRTYVPGDRMSRVSWPITARTGQMHVRAAGEGQEEFIVVVNLGPTGTASAATIEPALQSASTLVTQLLEDGHQVRLVTTELDQRVHDALRQSAIDNPRLPAVVPPGTPLDLGITDRFVVDEDDLARRLALAEPGPTVSWPYGSWVDISPTGIRTLP